MTVDSFHLWLVLCAAAWVYPTAAALSWCLDRLRRRYQIWAMRRLELELQRRLEAAWGIGRE